MAAEIHTLPPHNMNLMNETLVYDLISAENYHFRSFGETQDYSHYDMNTSSENFKYVDPNMNVNNTDIMKFPFSTMPPPPFKMVNNYNNNITIKNYDRRGCSKTRENCRTISPKEYESDESGASYSSTGSPDMNGSIYRFCTEESNLNNQNELNRQPRVFQPNLYQPNTNYNKNSRYSNGFSRPKQQRNADVMVRRAHGLMERFKSRAYKMRVHPNPPNLLNGGPWDQLNQAVWDLFVSKIQKEETYINKLNFWKSVFLFIRKCLSSYGLFLVGSTMSGFGLEGSDIDMCLLTKPIFSDARVDSLHHLHNLKYLLLKNGIASEAELIMAKVPILKFKNKETGFEVDLNCNNSVGIRNTHLLHCYAQLDWRVRPLVVTVKLWAQANHINDAKNMTISSYSWALMVIHYLQCGVNPPVLPCLHNLVPEKFNSNYESNGMDVQEEIETLKNYESSNLCCIGDLLIGFFQYYSYFNYSEYAISVRTGSRLLIEECKNFKTPKNDPNQWKCLCIEEPFDFSNTARSVFDMEVFKQIKDIILCSYKELARNKILNYILPVNLNRQR